MKEKEELIKELVGNGYLKTPRIIEAFRTIDRADFVRPEYQDEAYGNYPLSIGEGQTISQPLTVAFMLELLDPQPGEKILDVGAGSGWTTALLAHIIHRQSYAPGVRKNLTHPGCVRCVIGIERIPDLCEFGKKNLVKYFDESRAKIICGDGTIGFPEEAPYDKILAGAAALRKIPQAWRDQLRIGGKIVAPVAGSIWLFIKKSEKEWQEEEFPGFAFVPLIKDEHNKSYAARQRKMKIVGSWLLAIGLIAGAVFINEIYRPHASFDGSKSLEIPAGSGSRKIAEILKKEGTIRSKWAFILYVFLKGKASDLKPGSYILGQVSIPEIVNELIRGNTNEHVITIPEGWSVKNIAAYLEQKGFAFPGEGEAFLQLATNGQHPVLTKFDFLKDKSASAGLEGYLFPDTYRIFRDAKPEDIIAKMLENFGRKLTTELRQEIEHQGKTLFEIITMASLIEKEVPNDEDRAIVSGILWKRLKIGMALQVDATITYITGKKTTKIFKEETQIDSPYNTYKYPGLPQGPITNPGLSAIHAAIYPKDSPYLYYLSSPDGKTIFSRTLEEHNEAKVKYLTR